MVAGFCADPRIVTMRSMYEYPAPQPSPPPSSKPSREARLGIVAGVLATLAVVGGGLALAFSGDGSGPASEAATTVEEQLTATAPTTTSPDEGEASGAGEPDENVGNVGGEELPDEEDPLVAGPDQPAVELIEPLSPAPIEPEPLVPASVNPLDQACAAALGAGENLVVRPDPVSLPPAVLASSLEVHNCGAGTVDWTAATVPWVDLGTESGTLGGGETALLDYVVDTDDLGAFDFRIKVSEPGHNTYVDVDGFRDAVGRDFQAGGGSFTAGEGAGGCNNECIVSAQLTDNATTPDLGLRVKLDTPANVNVWVHTSAPSIDDDGDPFFTGVGLAAFTAGFETDWTTTLGGLSWDTEYFIVVEAIDENGGVSHRSGQFRTRSTGAGVDAGFTNEVDGGCSTQCIDFGQVVINPYTLNDVEIVNSAIVPADWTLWLSTQNPKLIDGIPTLGDEWIVAESAEPDQLFSHQVDGLEWNTQYHVVVAAEDDLGRRSYRSGFFQIGDEPQVLVTQQILRTVVTNDADGTGRGEITFVWGIPDEYLRSIGEVRLDTGDHVPFQPGQNLYQRLVDPAGFVPSLMFTMFERDHDPGDNFDIAPFLTIERGSSEEHFWNGSRMGLGQIAHLDGYTRCSEYGIDGSWADQACVRVDTDDSFGDQFPGFSAIIGIHVDTIDADGSLPPWND